MGSGQLHGRTYEISRQQNEVDREGGISRYVTLCLALAGSMCLGAFLIFHIDSLFDWTYTPYDHTVGHIALIAYPNQKEIVLFLTAVVVVPCCMAVGFWVQRLAGRAAQRYLGVDPRIAWWITGVALMLPVFIYFLGDREALLVGSAVVAGLLVLAPLMLATLRFLARAPAGQTTAIASASLAGLIAVASFALHYHFSSATPVDTFHEGAERLAPARAFTEGAMPYRDYYVVHGLGQDTLITAAAFKLFGMNLHSDRLLRAILSGATMLVAILLLRLLFGPGLLAPVVGGLNAFLVSGRWLIFYLLACALAMAFKTSGKKTWCLLSGFAAAACFLWSWDIGVIALPAAGLVLLVYGFFSKGLRQKVPQIMLFYVLGVLFVALPFGAFICANGAGEAFLYQHLEALRSKDHWDAEPFPQLDKFRDAPGVETVVFPYLALALVLFAIFTIVDSLTGRDRGPEWWAILFLMIFCVPFMKRAFGRSDFPHIVLGATPALLAICLLMGKAASSEKSSARHRVYSAAVIISALIVPVFHSLNYKPPSLLIDPHQVVQRHGDPQIEKMVRERLGTAKMTAYEFREISGVCEFLTRNSAPDDSFFDFSNGGLFHYLLPGRNPTRYFSSFYLAPWGMQRRAITAMEREKPRHVILTSAPDVKEWAGVHMEIRHALLSEYIFKNYTPVKIIGRYIIAERGVREDSTETPLPVVGVLSGVYNYVRVPELWGRYYLQDTLEGAQVLHAAEDVEPERPDADGYAESWNVSLPRKAWKANYLLMCARSRGSGRVEIFWHDTLRLSRFTTVLYLTPTPSESPTPYLIRVGSLSSWILRKGECKLKVVFSGEGALDIEKIVLIKKSEY